MKRNRLRLKKLSFISAVSSPAQPLAVCALTKSADGADEVSASFDVIKVDTGLNLVMGWAIVSSVGGESHFDLQQDHVADDGLLEAAMKYAEDGGAVDEQHDGDASSGRCLFLWPMTAEVAAAMQISTDRTGLLCGLKVTPEVAQKFATGELRGFSIAGLGEREPIAEKSLSASAEMARTMSRWEATKAAEREQALADRERALADRERALAEREQLAKSGAPVAITKNTIADQLDDLVLSVADQRNCSRTDALSALLKGNSARTREYRELRSLHDSLPDEAPAPASEPFTKHVGFVKSTDQAIQEQAWDQLILDTMRTKQLGRGPATLDALRSPAGHAIHQKLNMLAMQHGAKLRGG